MFSVDNLIINFTALKLATLKLLKAKQVFLFLIITSSLAFAQEVPDKVVNTNAQFWTSANLVFRIHEKWSVLNDYHLRRTNFIADPNFYFLRLGAQYHFSSNVRVAGGYAHLWLTASGDWDRYQNENRIYQQMSISQRYSKMNALFRLRLEQRFFNNVVNGESLNDDFLVNRVRFLTSVSFPFKEGGKTEFLLADEIHLNFGKNVVYNTFNQNRLTIGIKHTINEQWKFDFGYMMVYQQLAVGNVYNLNHTLRLFFYGGFDLRKNKIMKMNEVRHGEE